jgi:phosphoribosylformylglycinamidine (FGAM) synthase-like amidotransferase family enzyme
MYSLFLCIFVVHVSGAIYTHPQEYKMQSTALGVCNGCGMLVHTSWDTLTLLARSSSE